MAILVFLIAAAGATAIIWRLEQDRLQIERTHIFNHTGDHAHAIERHIERALSAAYALAALVRQGNGFVPNFEALAHEMTPFYPGASALGLAPGGVVQYLTPLAGNEKAIGHDLLQDPARTKEAFLARDSGELTLAGPFNLVQGGLGAAGRLPVFLEDETGASFFWGFAIVLIRFPDVLDPAYLSRLTEQGLSYELWRIHPDTGQKQVFAASLLAPLIKPVEYPVKVPNAMWTLSVSPAQGWSNPHSLAMLAALGLLFSLLLAVLAKLLIGYQQIAAALRQNEKRYRGLTEDMPALICQYLPDSTLTYVNQAYSDYFKKGPEELLGQRFLDLLPEEEIETVKATYLALTADAPSQTYQHPVEVDGAIRWQEWTDRAFFSDHSEIAYLQGVGQDITERKHAEAELRIAAAAFESQEGMIVTDAATVILRVNRAFTLITGYAAKDAIGQKPNLLKSNHHDAAFFASVWTDVQQDGQWQGEIWNRRPNGEVYLVWLTITAIKDEQGKVTHYIGTLTDITQRKVSEDEIKHLAFYDPLTELPNRRLLLDRLHQAMAVSARNKQEGALLFIDLDNFKTLNDTLGHDYGDLLLQQVAGRLTGCIREGDTVARLGGDEFVVMLADLSQNPQEATAQARIVGEKILASLNQPYSLANYEHRSTSSIGVTLFNHHRESVRQLLKQADLAMYEAKAAGRNTLRFFKPKP